MENLKNLQELMDFDLSTLRNESVYFSIETQPKLKKNQNFEKWRVVKPEGTKPRILIETTPKWLTITVYQPGNLKSRRINIQCSREEIKTKIKGIFEF